MFTFRNMCVAANWTSNELSQDFFLLVVGLSHGSPKHNIIITWISTGSSLPKGLLLASTSLQNFILERKDCYRVLHLVNFFKTSNQCQCVSKSTTKFMYKDFHLKSIKVTLKTINVLKFYSMVFLVYNSAHLIWPLIYSLVTTMGFWYIVQCQ